MKKLNLNFLMIFNTAGSMRGEGFGILLTQICLAKHSQAKTYTMIRTMLADLLRSTSSPFAFITFKYLKLT
ncbi:hypothetical protein DB41_GG00140 [Neochlamydia sp. TUME1]|nr:hypothetical protein DB41_GG00140 [Neochlamydia sp. TUME1]